MPLKIPEQEFNEDGNAIRYGIVPWDSRIFGFTVVEVSGIKINDGEKPDRLVSSFERFLKNIGVRMICVKVPAGEKEVFHGLQKSGYAFVEEMIKPYIDNIQKADMEYRGLISRPLARATEDKIGAIKGIAYMTFKDDRFHADRGFKSEKASERYAYWVDNSYRSGDEILYLTRDGAVAGFSIVTRSGEDAYLSLIGVGEAHKGRGLGMELLAGTCQHVKDEGVRGFSTTLSLNNISALNLYAECGFKFKDPVYVLHKWM